MADNKRVRLSEVGDVTVVQFVDRKILDEANIQELGQELFSLVEKDKRKKLVLNFSAVEFLSSAAPRQTDHTAQEMQDERQCTEDSATSARRSTRFLRSPNSTSCSTSGRIRPTPVESF